ncbi:hypothetical protein C8A01DRAFT_41029 [Parachaetomium inaequale]|uniref:BTB domain-containing protein n=1 Tax=Parachaetomium inaequale TaxID=2588326 RepID=A0AAN6P6H7_9PEZI|nr:hypothetical protein C8A01DRAFT_41029 [Parachaetomium inaequale]
MNPLLPSVVVLSEMPSDDEEPAVAKEPAVPNDPAPHILDDDGDLWLDVGISSASQGTLFKVCSTTIRRSSLVFKAMLFGPWMEAKPAEGKWIVKHPDDNPLAIGALLAVIHSRCELLPEPITAGLLYGIVIASDKYDMLPVLRPCARAWMDAAFLRYSYRHKFDMEALQLAHVAWEFGCEEGLTAIVERLVFLATLDELEELGSLRDEMQSHNFPYGPPDLLGKSNRMSPMPRLVVIQDILDFWAAEIARRIELGDGACCQAFPKPDPTERVLCDLRVLGVIIRHI